ncbi:hypothetical protein [Pseudomonas chlororaphis]|uniref:hypothetical protein n=1 Tax=Pseudomonas chlororaphis TaxID=587753 RepID=UPI000F58D9FF|nr:hypothetical protein [Pseudomonas chlororaphis]
MTLPPKRLRAIMPAPSVVKLMGGRTTATRCAWIAGIPAAGSIAEHHVCLDSDNVDIEQADLRWFQLQLFRIWMIEILRENHSTNFASASYERCID